VAGYCDPLFQAVEEAFVANFTAGVEVGAACAVIIDGRAVVDLWGGTCWRDGPPWTAETMVETRSATKGVAAACLHVLIDRGAIDLEAPLRRYWPELAADPLVRHALTHEAGIPVIDAELPENAILDWALMADAVARQPPEWSPGKRHGYHGVTFGWLVGELVRRVSGRGIGRFLREEITGPLAAEYFIGTPRSEHHRVAPLVAAPPRRDGRPTPQSFVSTLDPSSLAGRMYRPMFPPICPPWNSPEFREAEIPVSNGIGTARGLAAIYAELAAEGGRLVSRATAAALAQEWVAGTDAVLGIEVRRSLGFELPPLGAEHGRPPDAFGHPGASGFLAFADPHAHLGFAYVKNAGWNGEPGGDDRATTLVEALYASL
jgi:CubicO group peptidase (beta-lactamase class C family)